VYLLLFYVNIETQRDDSQYVFRTAS